MNGGSRSQIKVGLQSQAGEFDPEGGEKALKNSEQGRGMNSSAFLKGHSVGWVQVS